MGNWVGGSECTIFRGKDKALIFVIACKYVAFIPECENMAVVTCKSDQRVSFHRIACTVSAYVVYHY